MTALRAAVTWTARSPFRAFVLLFLLGVSIKVLALTQLSPRWVLPDDRTEGGATAFSLLEHGTFADPYLIPTGPTAHLPPLVPGILALLWRVFGTGSTGGYATWLFSIVALSAVYALLPWVAGKVGIPREAGALAGGVGSFLLAWGGNMEEVAALAMILMAVGFLRRWTSATGSLGGSFLFGVACGVAFHVQPVLLLVVLGWMAFELWWARSRLDRLRFGILSLGMVVACLPWAWRNYRTFDTFVFVRGNLGLELRMGNYEGAVGNPEKLAGRVHFRHPRTDRVEAELVRDLGEAEYMRRARAEALGWIRHNPAEFVALTASRAAQFWVGPFARPLQWMATTLVTLLAILGARAVLPGMSPPQRVALLAPVACYPLVYYVVLFMPRYRRPLEWVVLLLAGAAVWSWMQRSRPSARSASVEPSPTDR